METQRQKYEGSEFTYKKYLQIQRSFRNVFSTNSNVEYLIYVHESESSLYENDLLEIYKLIGYMYSKNLFSSDGTSFGEAIKKTKEKDATNKDDSGKYLNNLLNLDFKRLIVEVKNISGLFVQKKVKLNPHQLFSILNSWKSQTKAENKNWAKKKIIKDYFKKEEENVSK